jgi:hypothetical protein
MTQQKTAWFVQYKDNREIIVVKRIIFYLNPFTTTTKFLYQSLNDAKLMQKLTSLYGGVK